MRIGIRIRLARRSLGVAILFVTSTLLLTPVAAVGDLSPAPKYSRLIGGGVPWSGEITGRSDLARNYGTLLRRLPRHPNGVALDVVLGKAVPAGTANVARQALDHTEGYWLSVRGDMISLQSNSDAGIARGLARLISLSAAGDHATVPKGEWADWPDLRIRALLFVLGRHQTLSTLRKVVDTVVDGQFNTLIVQVSPKSVALSSFGDLADGNSLSQLDFERFVAYAAQSGLAVIPSLKLLTHQENLLADRRPDLMYNFRTYDPDNPKLYDLVLPMIDQLVSITQSKAFMINADEVFGAHPNEKEKLRSLHQDVLPAEAYLRGVLALHDHLRGLGVATWMWGDMFTSPKAFPKMFASSLHGDTAPGYGSTLLAHMPKDIVICDWHYFGRDVAFPSLRLFSGLGFRVLGATWKNPAIIDSFSAYAARNGGDGMIATTWASSETQMQVIAEVARESAAAFWNAARQ